jgi:hypothetical protein
VDEFKDTLTVVRLRVVGADCEPDSNQATVTGWTVTGVGAPLSGISLYNPGQNMPDMTYSPEWGREEQDTPPANYMQFVDGLLSIVGSLPLWTGNTDLLLVVGLPKTVTFDPHTGRFEQTADFVMPFRDTPRFFPSSYGMEFVGPVIQWTTDQDLGQNTSFPLPWSGIATFTEIYRSWLFPEERQVFTSSVMYADLTSAWKTANAEDPADGQASLVLHPINVNSLQGDALTEWPPIWTIGHEGALAVIKPAGISRPANWVGGNGCTPNVGDNDQWDVAAASTGPYAEIDLVNRFITRLDRLAAHTADTDFKSAWLIKVHRANVDVWPWASEPYSGQDYLDDVADRVDENIWCWKGYTYLQLSINAPRAATLTVEVTYGYISAMYDPCYVGFTYRFGDGPGEFTYTISDLVVTYDVAVAESTDTWSTAVIDLMVPTTGIPVPDMLVVKKIKVTLPDTGAAETWTLDDFRLVPDPDVTRRPLYRAGMYDVHDCVSAPSDYTGFRAHAEGKQCMDIPDGTEDHVKSEFSWKIRQKSRHSPPTPPPDLLDFAKVDSTFTTEIDFQEGWRCQSHNLKVSAWNRDGAGQMMLPNVHAFDARRFRHYYLQAQQSADPGDPDVPMPVGTRGGLQFFQAQEELGWPAAPIVARWDIVGGTHYRIRVEKFLQGGAGGMVVERDRSDRARSSATVRLNYRTPSGSGPWLPADEGTTDQHGYYEVGPYKTYDHEYQIGAVGTIWEIIHGSSPFELDNVRLRTTDLAHAMAVLRTNLRRDGWGRIWLVGIDDSDDVYSARLPHKLGPHSEWEIVAAGTYDHARVCPLPDGRILVAAQDTSAGESIIWRTEDEGATWGALGVGFLGDDLEFIDLAIQPGWETLYCVGVDSDVVYVEFSTDQGDTKSQFSDTTTRKQVDALNIASGDPPPPHLEIWEDGAMVVALHDDDGARLFTSEDRGHTWSELT